MSKYFEDKNKLLALVSSTGVVCILVALIANGFVRFDTNDDLFLSIFTSGFLGEYYARNVFSNIFLNYIFIAFNIVFHYVHLNGGMVVSLSAIVLAYFLLMYELTKSKGKQGMIHGFIIFFLSVETILNRYNFSKIGSLLMAVGIYLFVMQQKCEKKYIKTISLLMIILGGTYRLDTTIASFPFLTICFIYGYVSLKDENRRKKYIADGVICVAILIVLWTINALAYKSDKEWTDFTQFNKLRNKIIDYGIPSYEENRDVYEQIGWSENDCQFLSEWNYADSTVFNTESLEKVNNLNKDPRPIYSLRRWGHFLKAYVLSIPKTAKYIFTNICFWFIAVFAFLGTKKEYSFIFSIGTLLLVVGEIFYLFGAGRTPERALVIPLICGMVTLASFEQKRLNVGVWILALGIVLLCANIISFNSLCRKNMPLQEDMNECLKYMSSDSNNLYVWDIYTFAEAADKAYGPLDELPKGYLTNSVFMGGWIVPSPVLAKKSESFGDRDNVVSLLLEKDNVYYVSAEEPSAAFIEYYAEHYGVDIVVTKMKQIGRFVIYSISK